MSATSAPGRPLRLGPWPRRLWPGAGVSIALALAAYAVRLWLSASSGASLHVDEAQYWDWSRHLQWGYYSKPPVIAALVAWSTWCFGNSETGLRALPMLCYPLTALVLSALAADAARGSSRAALATGDAPASAAAAGETSAAASASIWAAAIWLASPLTGLLGLVVTTDGPLLLCWALALSALWWAVVRQRSAAWLLFSLAVGSGLLSKYSMAALLPGAAGWVLSRGGRRARLGFVAALLAALLLWWPNLVWNEDAGWPTWRHTADITMAAAGMASGLAGRLGDLLHFGLGQALVFGPAALVLAACLRHGGARLPGPMRALLWWTSLPLAALGAWQAWHGTAQLNWIAPLHLAFCLALAWQLALAKPAWRRRAAAALLVQALCVVLLTGGPGLAQRLGWSWPARLDPWARMRGWGPALAQLAPVLQAHPDALLVGTNRAVLAHAGYHGRGLGLARAAWQAGDGPPAHHYALQCRWQAGAGKRPVLVLSEGAPPDLGAGASLHTLARVPLRERAGQRLELWLSQLNPPGGATADTAVCR